MKSNGSEFKLIHGDSSGHRGRSFASRVAALAAILGAVALFSAAANPHGDADSAKAPGVTAQAPAGTPGFEYFPAGYVNAATVVEEHIQAF